MILAEDTNKKDTKKDTKKKDNKKRNQPKDIDKASIIFYVILVVGILIFVIMMIVKNNKQEYYTYFGEQIEATIKLQHNKDFILEINVDNDISTQKGTYTQIDKETTDKNTYYEVTFEDDTKASFSLNEELTTLTYDSGTYTVEFNKGN